MAAARLLVLPVYIVLAVAALAYALAFMAVGDLMAGRE
jgi:uncharacterized membrane protein YqhA